MQLSKTTIDVLKNFATLNPSILIREGNRQKTVTPQKNVMAVAELIEAFPQEFAIYDLNQFLGTVSLFESPSFEFGDKSVRIVDANGAVANYTYASKEAIVAAPDRDVVLPSTEVEFTLEEKSLAAALKAAAVMSLPNVTLVGRGGKVVLTASNTQNSSDHSWEVSVGVTEHSFTMIYRLELLKFLPRSYNVSISSKLITRFASVTQDVTYFIAAETGSSFT